MNKTASAGDKLELTRQFWNASPCDGQGDLVRRKNFRYIKDAFILPVLEMIAARHTDIVEVGCGQGIDGLTFCSLLTQGSSYRGFDYSDESLASAVEFAGLEDGLNVMPRFEKGNAEALHLEDNSVECIYSMGVLHHTPDTEQSIEEVFRILKPGGRAYIFLYNKFSPKVFIVHALRAIQGVLDGLFGTDRIIYKFLYGRHFEDLLGTALLEGFGVPVLRSYNRNGIHGLFKNFKMLSLTRRGLNLPPFLVPSQQGTTKDATLGLMWFAEIEKPNPFTNQPKTD
tara:strand:+ start:335 stop:1186 length:852 start_codon:yes stop_codon:yes gene_type:complete